MSNFTKVPATNASTGISGCGPRAYDSRFRSILETLDQLVHQAPGRPAMSLGAELLRLLCAMSSHIAIEQRSMELVGYPMEGSHRGHHEELIARMLALFNLLRSEPHDVLRALRQVRTLWDEHIEDHDRKFEDFLMCKG